MKNKVFSSVLTAVMALTLAAPAIAHEPTVEHLISRDDAKVDLVKVSHYSVFMQRENVIDVYFTHNFNSKYYNEGDVVQFQFVEDVKTKEGTCVIPSDATMIAKILKIQKPKWFSKNAKVTLEFSHILYADGKNVALDAELFGKKKYLQMTGLDTTKKIGAYTVGTGATGAGLGAIIGLGAGVIPGVVIGSSVGGTVGLVSGVVSPGLHFKAKKGKGVPVVLKENLKLPKM